MVGRNTGFPRRGGFGAGRHGRGAGRTGARDTRPWRGGGNQGGHQRRNNWEAGAEGDWGNWNEGQQQQHPHHQGQQQQHPHHQGQQQELNPHPQAQHQHRNPQQHQAAANLPQEQGKLACYGCGSLEHDVKNCPVIDRCTRCGRDGHGSSMCPDKNPWEFIAPLCAAQCEGQSFFYIENVTNPSAVKEKASTALITVTKGSATAQQIEQEFQDILGNAWRCRVKQWSPNEFSMRCPNAKKIEEWSHFRNMGMRRANAEINVDFWNPKVGAKGEAQVAWFRVRRIPMESRTEPVLAYVGSLVGVTVEIDKASIHKHDYVRLKIACRDVSKVPAQAEGMLGLFFYDFLFEREIPTQEMTDKDSIAIPTDHDKKSSAAKQSDLGERSPKKARTKENNENIVNDPKSGTSYIIRGGNTYKKSASTLVLVTQAPQSAPAKINANKNTSGSKKLMADAMKDSSYSRLFTNPPQHFDSPAKNKEKIDALNDLEMSDEEEDIPEIETGQPSHTPGQEDDDNDKQQHWMVNCHYSTPEKQSPFMESKSSFMDKIMAASPEIKDVSPGAFMHKEISTEQSCDSHSHSQQSEDSEEVTYSHINEVTNTSTIEKVVEKKKNRKLELIAPVRHSSRLAHKEGTVVDQAMERARKRNLEDLLAGLTKDELLQGVEGLLATVRNLMANQNARSNADHTLELPDDEDGRFQEE